MWERAQQLVPFSIEEKNKTAQNRLSFYSHFIFRSPIELYWPFSEAQTHKQPFLFKILERVLIAATCVITPATKQMQENDFSVESTAETWRQIWQKAIRICLISSSDEECLPAEEKNIPSCPQCKMREDTYNHWPQNSTLLVKYSAVAAEYFWCRVWCEPSVLSFP